MREGGKAEATIFLGDDHAQEAAILDELPYVRGQIAVDVRRLPIADECAQLFAVMVDELLLLGGEFRLRHGKQLVPVRAAGEQIAIPPHGAGFDGLALGLRHRRQYLAECGKDSVADQFAAQRRQVERKCEQHQCRSQDEQHQRRQQVRAPGDTERRRDRDRPRPTRDIEIREGDESDDDDNEPDQYQHEQLRLSTMHRPHRRAHRARAAAP